MGPGVHPTPSEDAPELPTSCGSWDPPVPSGALRLNEVNIRRDMSSGHADYAESGELPHGDGDVRIFVEEGLSKHMTTLRSFNPNKWGFVANTSQVCNVPAWWAHVYRLVLLLEGVHAFQMAPTEPAWAPLVEAGAAGPAEPARQENLL